ncbi:MAG TPA: UbiD family decarboxylase, partial [Candidatus Binatia bacterium]
MANAQRDGAAPEEVRDLRSAIEWMKKEGDILVTDKEVDPDLEITGIQKQLDGGCPILFNNVKGKPHHRCITNLFGDMSVINKMFGWKDHADRTRKLAYAITHPIAPIVVDQKDAPVQEEVYEKPAEANDFVVPIRHTNIEPELTVGSGNRLISGEYFNGGTDLGYNRMNFRWG